ncbi:TPA: restriction endonuclease subunit S [Staphylococcus aureus]|nr:restriction endonuclease subunit S [Staphylococcus aureus]
MSNTQKKNVPELRFPEFEGEWEEKKLGENAIIKGRLGWKGLKQSEYLEKGYAYLIANKHINSGHINWEKADQISRYRYEESPEIALEKGDLIFSKDGALGNPALINNLTKPATINSTMMLVRLDQKNFSSIFFYQILLGPLFNKLIYLKVSGSSIPHLFQADMKEFKFNAPPLIEQQKIGKFFSKLDQQIELEEQKLELLQQQKKGYMQKIFSQELRFKDENGNDYPDWTNERLGEVTTVTMGQSPKSVNYTDNSNDTVLIQGNADIENGLINPRIYTREVTKLIQKDEIILTVRAPVGKLAMAQINACIGRGVCSIKGDKFLYYFLEWFATQNKWIRFSQGSTFESISGNDIRNIHIKIPVEDERTKIIKLLNSLDVLNSKTDLKIQNLKQRKKSLLQKLFI